MTDTHEKFSDAASELLYEVDAMPSDGHIHIIARALSEAHQDGIREGKRQAAELADAHAKELRKVFANDCARAVQGVRADILSTITDEAE